MKKSIFTILALFNLVFLQSQDFNKIKQESSIHFKIKNFGVNVDGHFQVFNIETQFNTEDELIDVKANIKVETINTGMQSRDKHLLKEDFFNSTYFPEIVLNTTGVNKVTLQNYTLIANLKIKGFEKEMIIPIKIENYDKYYKITSNFEINRKDFNIGKSSLVLGKKVKIRVKYYHEK